MNLRVLLAAALIATGCEEKIQEPSPKARAEGLYVLANAHYLQGDFDKALQLLNESKALFPENPLLPIMFGEIYLSQGKLNEALAEFQNAAKSDPRRATTWSRIGYIQAQLGQREEARASVRKALGLNPNDFNALEQLGEIELKDDNFDEAVKHLIAAAETATEVNKPRLYLRAVDALMKKERRAEAALVLKTAVGKSPNLPGEVWVRLGELLALEGDIKGALNAYITAARALPRDPVPWEIVGEIYRSLDKPGDAEAAWRESLKIDNRAIVWVQIARLKLARKEEDAARLALDNALAAATGTERRESIELADLLVEMKRKQDALRLLALIAAEEENLKDEQLQLKTAKLAKELKDTETTNAACARAVDAGVPKCP